MGRGAQQQGQGQGAPGYNNPSAGGISGQLPSLGGEMLPPEMMVGAYRQMGRAFGGAPPGRAAPQRANAFAPAGGPMGPDALPITASSGPASTQTSPVAPTQSGVTPPSPASGFTGAAPTPEQGGPPAGRLPGQGNMPGGPGQQQLLTQALRAGG